MIAQPSARREGEGVGLGPRKSLLKKHLSLYIHIPFCKNICLYCNFLTFANKNKFIPQYVDALLHEIKNRGEDYKNFRIETIYFGGGTPSLIEPKFIKKILDTIRDNYNVVQDVEISIECNPESVDAQRIKIYQDAGITRFSLGVQSLNQKTLQRVARPHDSKTIFKALQIFSENNVTNFGTDLIMGLPYQTLATFQTEVEKLLSYKPTHFSSYFLSYDTKRIDLFIKDSPEEEIQIAMYEWLCKYLQQIGFSHYEVSNWARPGHECRHNQRYWEQKDYLGLGLGAHSIVEGEMWENQKNFSAYLKNPLPIIHEMKMDQDLRKKEYVMLSLRTHKGIDREEYKQFGEFNALKKFAETFAETGHLKITENKIATTEKGFLIVDAITRKMTT